MENKSYIIKNVRLEVGFSKSNNGDIITKTDLFNIEIENGKFKDILPIDHQYSNDYTFDAKGLLMLPAFKDMHIHLDKTLYGLPWQALSTKRTCVADMIAYEQEIIPQLLETSIERGEKLINLLQSYGTSYVRTHFNIDPTSKLDSLINLEKMLLNKKASLDAELVAFPQHGLYYTDSAALMQEVAQLNSVGYIGGLDPFSIDGSIERPIDYTLQLALDYNKGVDIHLHELGKNGISTINYLIEQVLKNPSLKGKTYISHAYVLAHLDNKQVKEIAIKLAEAKIGIVSAIPVKKEMIMPIPTLLKYGVNVLIGTDNIQDYWSVMGSGSMLQKSHIMSELYGWEDEFNLSRSLQFATNGVTPLNSDGTQQWPKIGDDASAVFVNASCSAEAVARLPHIDALIHKGYKAY